MPAVWHVRLLLGAQTNLILCPQVLRVRVTVYTVGGLISLWALVSTAKAVKTTVINHLESSLITSVYIYIYIYIYVYIYIYILYNGLSSNMLHTGL